MPRPNNTRKDGLSLGNRTHLSQSRYLLKDAQPTELHHRPRQIEAISSNTANFLFLFGFQLTSFSQYKAT